MLAKHRGQQLLMIVSEFVWLSISKKLQFFRYSTKLILLYQFRRIEMRYVAPCFWLKPMFMLSRYVVFSYKRKRWRALSNGSSTTTFGTSYHILRLNDKKSHYPNATRSRWSWRFRLWAFLHSFLIDVVVVIGGEWFTKKHKLETKSG